MNTIQNQPIQNQPMQTLGFTVGIGSMVIFSLLIFWAGTGLRRWLAQLDLPSNADRDDGRKF